MEAEMEATQDIANLMHRRNNGIEVWLNWHRAANILSVVLVDERAEPPVNAEFIVPNDKGMEAFDHPFAWLPEEQTVRL